MNEMHVYEENIIESYNDGLLDLTIIIITDHG